MVIQYLLIKKCEKDNWKTVQCKLLRKMKKKSFKNFTKPILLSQRVLKLFHSFARGSPTEKISKTSSG